jgi:hypothetical protein
MEILCNRAAFTAVIVITTFFCSCTNRTLLSGPDAHPSTLVLSGDMEFCVKGEKNSLGVTILSNDTFFRCEFQSLFGNTVATFQVHHESVLCDIDNSHLLFDRNDRVAIPIVFPDIPFRFVDLERILSGNLPFLDNIDVKQHKGIMLDSISYTLEYKRNTTEIASALYAGRQWNLAMTKFKNCIAHDIYFAIDENNYFKLLIRRSRPSGKR